MRWNLVELPFNIFERPACINKKDPHACRPKQNLFPYDAILFGNLNYYFVYLLVIIRMNPFRRLVYQRIMPKAERLSESLAEKRRANVKFLGQSRSRGHYQPTYQPLKGVFLLNAKYIIYFFINEKPTKA